MYFGPEEGAMWESYMDVVKEMSHRSFHSDEACASNYNVKAPGFAVVREKGKSPVAYIASTDQDMHLATHIQDFLELETTPLFIKSQHQLTTV